MKIIRPIILVVAGLLMGVLAVKFIRPAEKTGYIEVQKVFNDFIYKKELEAQLKQVKEIRKNKLDSMEMELKILSKELQLDKKNVSKIAVFQTKRDDFLKLREQYDTEYSDIVKRYDEMIYKQMNQYIKNFGEINRYKYIYGAEGNGSLMFADTANNLTGEVTKFINESYKGKK